LREHQDELDSIGARVLGVGTREDFQAAKLIEDGMPFPLLLDPENSVRAALGMADRFGLLRLLHPMGAVAYVKAARQAKRFDPVWGDATQRPGVAIFDSAGALSWTHLGTRLGDYPTVGSVLTALSAAR
jgi:hypothetical protein